MAILVLEDEPTNMAIFGLTLRSKGYIVIEATSATQARSIGKQDGSSLDLIIADIKLPGGSGLDVAVELITGRPALPVLFVSGTPMEGWTNQEQSKYLALDPSRLGFLQKPFLPSDLLFHVKRLLQQCRPIASIDNSSALEQKLRQAMEQARAEYVHVVSQQYPIIADSPGDLPHPDGLFRLQQIAKLRRAKYQRFLEAKGAIEEFLRTRPR
jgi:DNA-binding response OmpR family regulator